MYLVMSKENYDFWLKETPQYFNEDKTKVRGYEIIFTQETPFGK